METTKNGNGTGLARAEPKTQGLALSGSVRIENMADVFRLAQSLSKARGFVPDAYVDKPEALAAVILTGLELNLGPMQAMREVYLVKGRPSLSATLMLALARRAGVRTRWLETSATKATIGVTVPGEAEQTLTFSEADAKAAGLWGQGTWKVYPAAMLRARATSAAMRAFCPDVLGGSVYEADSGEITEGRPALEVQAEVVREPEPAPPTKPTRLSATTTPTELRAWCEENAAAVRDGGDKALGKVLAHGGTLQVPVAVVRQWLGVSPMPPREDENGELDADPPVTQ